MANDLRFGIVFDLDKGIKEAIAEGDKGLKRLEAAIAKHPITVKVKLDTGKGRRGSASELTDFKKQLAELTQEWNKLTAAERGGAAGAALRERYRDLQKEAQGYVSTPRAAVSQEDKLASAVEKTNGAYGTQSSYLNNFIRQMVAYWSVERIKSFFIQIRNVTVEFELQRV